MKKRALELSVNFLIIIILAVVIFGFGIYIANKIFNSAASAKDQLDSQTREQIEGLLQSGERVIIPRDYETVYRGDSAVFGLGILNTDSYKDFKVIVLRGSAFKEDGATTTNKLDCKFTRGTGACNTGVTGAFTIEQNQKLVTSVVAIVPSTGITSGTHILNVYVCHNFGPGSATSNECTSNGAAGMRLYDDSVHKIHVVVP